jgi:predicted glycosyltransferase
MRILVDINHPHHVHLFRNAIMLLREKGHEVLITARDKDVSVQLLRKYDLPYILTGKSRPGPQYFLSDVLSLDWKIYKIAKSFQPGLMIGTSFAIAHASKFLRSESMVFGEDNVESSPLFWFVTRPFADYIVTPDSIPDNLGENHITYSGYQELAYLHPKYFLPNANVLKEQGIAEGEPFSLMRFVALKASHDIGQRSISENTRRRLVEILLSHGKLIISSEGVLSDDYENYRIRVSPEKVHDLMAFAKIFVGDSQTMSIESSVLGIPSVRCNTFVGRTPVFDELEKKYMLSYGYSPDRENEMVSKVEEIMNVPAQQRPWQRRRETMLQEKIDLTRWMIQLIEKIGGGGD